MPGIHAPGQGYLLNDDRVHAFLGTPPTALCNNRVLVRRLGGFFEPAAFGSCSECARVARQLERE